MTKRCEPPIVIDYTEYTWKEVDNIKKELIQKDATIRQLEKIIYKLYMDKQDDLSTGDVHNIIRIADKYSRGDEYE